MQACLYRHSRGDWGNVCGDDKATNDQALIDGDRVLSAYPIDPTKPSKGFGENCLWIITELEKGERPWMKPWNAEHAAGKISRPLRHNGLPYSGINVLMLWLEAEAKGYSAPLWMTFKQAQELCHRQSKNDPPEAKSPPIFNYNRWRQLR